MYNTFSNGKIFHTHDNCVVSYMETNSELESVLESVSLPSVDMIEVPESEGETAVFVHAVYSAPIVDRVWIHSTFLSPECALA